MNKILLTSVLFFVLMEAMAQNVGINNADPKAALDLNGGFRLRPENTTVTGTSVMLTSNRSHHVLIGSPVADFNIAFTGATENGQHAIITNTTLRKGFLVPIYIQPNSTVELIYSNGAWKLIGTTEPASSTAWGLTGNAGTDTSINFIGTTDNQPLVFKINNERAGLIDKGANTALGYLSLPAATIDAAENTAVGSQTLRFLKDGTKNTAIGAEAAGNLKSGSLNVAVGQFALLSDTAGSETVAVGPYALAYNQNREGNTAVGAYALVSNALTYTSAILPTQGLQNTAIGHSSLYSNQRGSGAVAIGYKAAYTDTAAESIIAIGRAALFNSNGKPGNVAIGDSALFNTGVGGVFLDGTYNIGIGDKVLFNNVIGHNNTAIGSYAMLSNNSTYNTAVGSWSLNANTSGSGNTAVGLDALRENRSGSFNVGMGFGALTAKVSGNNNTGIGHNALRGNESTPAFHNNNTAIGSYSMRYNITGNCNTALGDSSLLRNERGYSNVAIGAKALARNLTQSNLVAVGDSALYNNNGGVYNTAIGSKTLFASINGSSNTAVGFEALRTATGSANTAIGSAALYYNNLGEANVALGNLAYSQGTGSYNIAIGYDAGFNIKDGNRNTIIGSDDRLVSSLRNISGSVFIGFQSGGIETTDNKLYIENSFADKNNALIYGDFAADSLLLNAKTVVRNNAVVKGYTKLGGYEADVPSIKMKKISIASGPAVNGVQSYPLGSGITDAKVVGIQVLMNYAGSWKIPPSYIDAAGYEYNVQVQNNGIVIILKSGNSANIGGKPISVIVTYEE